MVLAGENANPDVDIVNVVPEHVKLKTKNRIMKLTFFIKQKVKL